MGKAVTFYMKSSEKWDEFIDIAKREGKSSSEILQKYIENYVSLHAPGNPQTLMPSFGTGGKVTISNIEGRVRQLCIESMMDRIISWRKIVEIINGEGISDGSMRVAMATRVRDWLMEKDYKVTQGW